VLHLRLTFSADTSGIAGHEMVNPISWWKDDWRRDLVGALASV
jgi:hypothetical protein